MSTISTTPAADVAVPLRAAAGPRSLRTSIVLLLDLTKARLSAMVVMSTLMGFVLATGQGPTNWGLLLATMLGTTLAALGANGLNQWLESDLDARMRRTQNRPIPSGRLRSSDALLVVAVCGIAGPALLFWLVNILAGVLALATIALYALVYTPMKLRSSLNTFVGAIVGAIPPMIGWVAVTGKIDGGTLLLAALLFAWQIPHFFALAWMYRQDYHDAGYRMLPEIDPTGRVTAGTALGYALLLLPISFGFVELGLCGTIFLAGAIVAGLGITWLGVRFCMDRSRPNARNLFLGSILYLPLIFALIAVDH
ncbi:MAG: heme o synthase [Phycisphaerae bacterium]